MREADRLRKEEAYKLRMHEEAQEALRKDAERKQRKEMKKEGKKIVGDILDDLISNVSTVSANKKKQLPVTEEQVQQLEEIIKKEPNPESSKIVRDILDDIMTKVDTDITKKLTPEQVEELVKPKKEKKVKVTKKETKLETPSEVVEADKLTKQTAKMNKQMQEKIKKLDSEYLVLSKEGKPLALKLKNGEITQKKYDKLEKKRMDKMIQLTDQSTALTNTLK